MLNFVMLTRVPAEAAHSPEDLAALERQVSEHIRAECPSINWIENLALLGPWDYLDTFQAPDHETAAKAAALVRTYGHAETEVWAATEWDRFKETMEGRPEGHA